MKFALVFFFLSFFLFLSLIASLPSFTQPRGFIGIWSLLLPTAGWLGAGWDHRPWTWACADVQWMAFWCQRAGKLHSQIMLSASILNMQKHVTQMHVHRTSITSPFNLPPITFPQPKTTCLSLKYPNPLPSGRRSWDLFSCLLTWLPCE